MNKSLFKVFSLITILALMLMAAPMQSALAAGPVSLTILGTPYTQNFDTLPASGSSTWTNDSTIPGWFHARTGTGATIVANNGSSNAGNLYSYGTGTDTDRALGSVGSSNAAVGNLFWGVRLSNDTGTTITSLDISYTGEQWRNSAATAQTVAFSYLVGSPGVTGTLAEFQSAGVAAPSLDFTSPITGGTAGVLDGNLAANRVTITFSITGLSIPNGTEVMLRWADPDHGGSDHGLSIDDFSVTAHGGVTPINLSINDVSATEGDSGTTTFNFTVSLSGAAGAGGVTFDIATEDGTAQDDNPATEDNDYVAQSLTGQSIGEGSTGPYNFDVTVNGDTAFESNETFFVNVTNVTGATVIDNQGQGTIQNDDVETTPTNPSGTGLANPSTVIAGGSTLLTVTVTPGTNPTSTGLAVSCDLSSIGGGAAQSFFDNATNGDTVNGDNVFSFQAVVDSGTSPGVKNLACTITDAQVRSGNASIALTVPPPAAPLVINELDYDQPGTDTAEFAEIKNISASSVNLDNYQLWFINGNGGATYDTIDLPNVTLGSGDYFVVCANAATITNCDLDDSPNTNWIQNGAPDAVALVLIGNVVDTVSYDGDTVAPYTEGSGAGLIDNAANANLGISRLPDGVDTNQNNVDFSLRCITPGEANTTGTSGCVLDLLPNVATTNPSSGATNVSISNNIDINFSEAVTANGNWFSISCANSSTHTAAVSGGPQNYTLDPDVDFAFTESCSITIVAANVADQDGTPNNMTADYTFSFTTSAQPFVCGDPATFIHDVQGSGLASPFDGSVVTVEGVVVGSFQGLGGFHVQEEDADADANAATSEGIFVFNNANTPVVGDKVRIQATVDEFNNLTELTSVTNFLNCGSGNPLPAPTVVSLPEATNNDLERYEGMLITLPQTLTVSQNFFQGRYGQVTLSANGRLFNPTNLFAPLSPGAIDLEAENARRLLVLDDGQSAQNPNPIPYIGLDNTLRAGDTVSGITGVLDYGLITSDSTTRDYRLQPTTPTTFTRINLRTATPDSVGGNVKVASFNVLNYFNGDGLGGGFPTPRGANNMIEFTRQRDKIIAAITAMDADVIGLMELENDAPPNSAIEDLVSGLNAATAPGTYSFINTGIVGTDEIRVGILYKPATATPIGAHAVLTSVIDPDFIDTLNRPVIVQTFQENSTGARFTVAVNHLKSKGSDCNAVGDPDTGDGQGNCNLTRTAAAEALVDWLATDPTGSGDPDYLIIGDLNSYAMEDPITAIKNAGYTDLIKTNIGNGAYSYVFDGLSGYLDHALATASLTIQVSGITEWHINTDEPSVIDYNTEFKPQDLYAPTPYRSSDHDPVMVGLSLTVPDTTAPDTFINSAPLNPSNSSSASFTFSGTDTGGSGVVSFECDLDSGGFSACSSPQNYIGLLDGSHTFQVRAIDGANNVDPTPASFTWVIDTTAPQVTINQASGQSDPTSNSPIHFTAVFNESVIGFGLDSSDVTISGTAGATTAVVTSGPTTYDVAISGMTSSGTVIVNIPANAATDAAGNSNVASTSTDKTVTFNLIIPAPTCNAQTATIYVNAQGKIVGGPQNGQTYQGLLTGTNGNDVIVGTNNADTILALGGNDVVCSLGGSDTISGGTGNDTINSGSGNDTVFGNANNDVIDSGEGNDTAFGESGNDTINGGNGKDNLFGGDGLDVLDGGADKDVVDGGLGVDTLAGGSENDTILGGPGNDALNGGGGSDICNGGVGTDTSSSCETNILIP